MQKLNPMASTATYCFNNHLTARAFQLEVNELPDVCRVVLEPVAGAQSGALVEVEYMGDDSRTTRLCREYIDKVALAHKSTA